LISLSFSISHILFANSVIGLSSSKIYTLNDPSLFLIAPLLWLYVKELIGERVGLRNSFFIHLLPFFVVIIYSILIRFIENDNSFISLINANKRNTNIFFWIIVVAQFSFYLHFVRKKLLYHQSIILQEVSNKEYIDISWVRFFLLTFLSLNIFFFVSLFTIIHFDSLMWQPKLTALVFSLAVIALAYKGILQKNLFSKSEAFDQSYKYHLNEDLPNKIDLNLKEILLAYMNKEKPYLDAELTLTSLAKDLKISRSQLSLLINEGIGDNFYDFVNKYRVDEVKRLMSGSNMKNYSLLGIALEAGFKSKSTFNLVFKRFTGLTPTEFKKNISL
jgi:AraC-like DNA-binding protein